MGEFQLTKYLEDLLISFDKQILSFLGKESFQLTSSANQDLDSIFKPSKSIKQVLAIQKQYISLLNAYSQIISCLKNLNEIFVLHFYKVIILGFSSHYRFYEKYKIKLSEVLASMIVNMMNHEYYCWSFLRKVIKNGFLESIKLTENMIFQENTENASITEAVNFWILLLSRDNIFSEFTLKTVFGQLIVEIIELIRGLNIRYKSIESTTNEGVKIILYEPDSESDLEIYNRICLFLKYFSINCYDNINKSRNSKEQSLKNYSLLNSLLDNWGIFILLELIDIGTYYPRVSCTYSLISSLIKCNKEILSIDQKSIEEFRNFKSNIDSVNINSQLKVSKKEDEEIHNYIYDNNLDLNLKEDSDTFINDMNTTEKKKSLFETPTPHNNNNISSNINLNNKKVSLKYSLDNNKQAFLRDKIYFLENFKTFSLFILKKIEIFQDELLLNCIELILSTPPSLIELIYFDKQESLITIFKKALELGYNDFRYSNLALQSIKALLDNQNNLSNNKSSNVVNMNLSNINNNSKIGSLPQLYPDNISRNIGLNNSVNIISSELLEKILPLFGDYLVEYQKIKKAIKNSTNNKELISKYTRVQDKIFDILGSLGGDAHMIINNYSELNDYKDSKNKLSGIKSFNESNNQSSSSFSMLNPKSINYNLPLFNKKYNVNLDHLVFKIAEIALNSADKSKKLSACELFHSIIIYIIGLETKKNIDTSEISLFVFEKTLTLACDIDKSICSIFEPLLFQIIRWLAKKSTFFDEVSNTEQNFEIEIKFIDCLIENSTLRQNIQLRELCTEGISEYIKWYIKYHNALLKEKSFSIKYLIRKCESYLNHRDIYKRLGACLCLEKILIALSSNEILIAKFLLEIVYYLITMTKLEKSNNEKDSFIFDLIFSSAKRCFDTIISNISKFRSTVIEDKSKRQVFKTLKDLMLFLIEKFISDKDECRYFSLYLFFGVFKELNDSLIINYENFEDFKSTINKWVKSKLTKISIDYEANIKSTKECLLLTKTNSSSYDYDNNMNENNKPIYHMLLFLLENNIINNISMYSKELNSENLMKEFTNILDTLISYLIDKPKEYQDINNINNEANTSNNTFINQFFYQSHKQDLEKIYSTLTCFIILSELIFKFEDKIIYLTNNRENYIIKNLISIASKLLETKFYYLIIFINNQYEEITSKTVLTIFKWIFFLRNKINSELLVKTFLAKEIQIFKDLSLSENSKILEESSFSISYLNFFFVLINSEQLKSNSTDNSENKKQNNISTSNNNGNEENDFYLFLKQRKDAYDFKGFGLYSLKSVFKSNVKILLDINLPKFHLLMKKYFTCICAFDFKSAFEIINSNQFHFDLLADAFFSFLIDCDYVTQTKESLINNSEETRINNNNNDNKLTELSNLNKEHLFLDLIHKNNINFSKDELSSITNIFDVSLENKKIVHEFIQYSAVSESRILYLFILLDKVIQSNLQINTEIETLFLSNIQQFTNIDNIITQIKVANLFLLQLNEKNFIVISNVNNSITKLDTSLIKTNLTHLSKLMKFYINHQSINVIKDLINFIGCFVKTISELEIIQDKSLNECIFSLFNECRSHFRVIQSRYFPVKTKYLHQNTKEYTEFEIIFSCFLQTFSTVKNFEFLEMLFPIIREEKTIYYGKVSNTIDQYIEFNINSKNNLLIVNEISKIIDLFLSKNIDYNIKDNIRFSIMKLIGFKFLNKVDETIIRELFVKYYHLFKNVLDQNIANLGLDQKLIVINEKAFVFKIFSILFSKIDVKKYKEDVHRRIFNEGAQGNEITGILALEFHNAKRMRIPEYEFVCKEILESGNLANIDKEYLTKIENRYYAFAYNALIALVKLTQKKEEKFIQFLFKTNRVKNEILWENVIGNGDDFDWYTEFNVETNFSNKEVKVNNNNEEETGHKNNNSKISQINHNDKSNKNRLLIDQIITDSFFHGVYGKSLKESFISFTQSNTSLINNTLSLNRNNPNNKNENNIQSLLSDLYSNNYSNTNISKVIELDKINKHPIMESLVIIIEYMFNTFTLPQIEEIQKRNSQGNNNIANSHLNNMNLYNNPYSTLPSYLECLLQEVNSFSLTLHHKIFFAKLIINLSDIFSKYINHFLSFLINISTDKILKTKAKGFHYFLRDIATLIISSDITIIKNKENCTMISTYINSLCKLVGDTKNLIFRTNLKIVTDLIYKFKDYFSLDKQMLVDMLKIQDSKPSAHIWKVTAVQLLATALEANIPLFNYTNSSNISSISNISGNDYLNPDQDKFLISITDDIYLLLFKLNENTRMPVQSAMFEFLGKVMFSLKTKIEIKRKNIDIKNNNTNREVSDYLFFTNELNSDSKNNLSIIFDFIENLLLNKQDKFCINMIFRVSLHFPGVLVKKKIFNKALSYFKSTTQNNRVFLLSAYTWLMNVLIENDSKNNSSNNGINNDINFNEDSNNNQLLTNAKVWKRSFFDEIYYSILNQLHVIFVDPSEDLISAIIVYLESLIKLYDIKYLDGIIKIIEFLQKTIPRKDASIREDYYSFLFSLYENKNFLKNKLFLFNILVQNINYDTENKNKLLLFLNEKVLPKYPVERFIFLLNNLNLKIEVIQSNFIQLLTMLMLILSFTSSDYELKIYEKPLDDKITFKDLDVGCAVGSYLNRSMPVPPSLNLRNTMNQTYMNFISNIEKQGVDITGIKNTGDLIHMSLAATQNKINEEAILNSNNSKINTNTYLDYMNTMNNASNVNYINKNLAKELNINNNNNINSSNNISNLNNIIDRVSLSRSQTINAFSTFVDSDNINNQKRIFKIGETNKFKQDLESNVQNTENSLGNYSSFKAPLPVVKQNIKKRGLGKFMSDNEFSYNPSVNNTLNTYNNNNNKNYSNNFNTVNNNTNFSNTINNSMSNTNNIRFIPDGTFNNSKNNETSNNQRILMKFLNRQITNQKKIPKLLRKYRVGELPDIEIKNNELIIPLIEIVSDNVEIASELLLELFSKLLEEAINNESIYHSENSLNMMNNGNLGGIGNAFNGNISSTPGFNNNSNFNINAVDTYANNSNNFNSINSFNNNAYYPYNNSNLANNYLDKIALDNFEEIQKSIQKLLDEGLLINYYSMNFLLRCYFQIITNISSSTKLANINLKILKESALLSNNYYSGILVVEEIIKKIQDLNLETISSNTEFNDKIKKQYPLKIKTDILLNDETKDYWITLLSLYSKLLMKDYKMGIIQNFSIKDELFLKNSSDFLSQFSYLLTSSKDNIYKFTEINKLLKSMFKIDNNDSDNDNKVSSKYDVSLIINNELLDSLENYCLESCSDLGEWDNITHYVDKKSIKENIVFGFSEKQSSQYLKYKAYSYVNGLISENDNGVLVKKTNNSSDIFKKGKSKSKSNPAVKLSKINSNNYGNSISDKMELELNQNNETSILLDYERNEEEINSELLNLVNNNKHLKYYLALDHIKLKEFDNALLNFEIYKENLYDELSNISKSNSLMRHNIIIDIQKLFELNECLVFLRDHDNTEYSNTNNLSKKGIDNLKTLLTNWLSRWPDWRFDKPGNFQEILISRKIFINSFKQRFNNLDAIFKNESLLESFVSRSHIKLSEEMYKKKLFDISEIEMKKALTLRKEGMQGAFNSFILLPILRIKYKILKMEVKNIEKGVTTEFGYDISNVTKDCSSFDLFKKKSKKFDLLLNVLNEHSRNSEINFNDKLNIKILQSKILLELSNLYYEEEKGNNMSNMDNNSNENMMSNQFTKTIEVFSKAKRVVKENYFNINGFNNDEELFLSEKFKNNSKFKNMDVLVTCSIEEMSQKRNIIRPIIKQAELLMRKMESSLKNNNICLKSQVNDSDHLLTLIQDCFTKFTLEGLCLSDNKLIHYIPKLLELIKKQATNNKKDININITNDIIKTFTSASPYIPINYFLYWKNELLRHINTENNEYIEPLILNILKFHPQELFFPFTCIDSYSDIFSYKFKNISILDDKQNTNTDLYYKIKSTLKNYTALDKFSRSLEFLVHPGQRLKFWLDEIVEFMIEYFMFNFNKRIIINHQNNIGNNNFLIPLKDLETSIIQEITNYKNAVMGKIEKILSIINEEVLCKDNEELIGDFNEHFSKQVRETLEKDFSINKIEEILNKDFLNYNHLQHELYKLTKQLEIKIHLSNVKNNNSMIKLSSFSRYLAQYELDDKGVFDQIPLPINHFNTKTLTNFSSSYNYSVSSNKNSINNNKSILISSFDNHIQVLNSLRVPKKIIFNCNNEKSYMYMLKGGEDLRIDQRIMEIFSIFNSIFQDSEHSLKLNTYSVFPINIKLGLVSWIPNTITLKSIIEFSMMKVFNRPEFSLNSSESHRAKVHFLQKAFGNNNPALLKNIEFLHIKALYSKNTDIMISNFKFHESLLPKNTLKQGLEHHLLTPEEVLSSRITFIRKYSVLSIACYILGIGDRHLDNFLINKNNSEIFAIDFGISFGQNLSLSLPELIPFRLTSQFRNVISPIGVRGSIRQNMVEALYSLKNRTRLIVDYCEVLVKDPILNWLKSSELINIKEIKNDTNENNNDSNNESNNTYKKESYVKWMPVKKLKVIEDKLLGVNPIKIIINELKDTNHFKKEPEFSHLCDIVKGCEDSLRSELADKNLLKTEEQVDILIEQAIDENILSRTWIGWSPFV